MRPLKTRITARQIVNQFDETRDLFRFIERCIEDARWFGRYSYRNRKLFQGFIKEALEERGLIHVLNREEV